MNLIYNILRNIENNSQHIYLINVHLYPGSHAMYALRFMCFRPIREYNEFSLNDTGAIVFLSYLTDFRYMYFPLNPPPRKLQDTVRSGLKWTL